MAINQVNEQPQHQTNHQPHLTTSMGSRANYALWDQLGLLHWLKRNVAFFGGNSRNLTLLALDNKASLCIQLLTMSPLSKGLFKRAILIHNENEQGTELDQRNDLDSLFQLASQSHDLKRRLSATLSQVIQVLETSAQVVVAGSSSSGGNGSDQAAIAEITGTVASSLSASSVYGSSNNNIFDVIQAANLSQLAKIEAQFKQLASEKLIAFASQPNLEDPILFPDLLQLASQETWLLDLSLNSAIGSKRAELDYCLYLRSLLPNHGEAGNGENDRPSLSTEHDPLRLLNIPFKWTENKSTNFRPNIHRESSFLTSNHELPSKSNPSNAISTTTTNQQHQQIFIAFHNLFNLNTLNAMLSGEWSLFGVGGGGDDLISAAEISDLNDVDDDDGGGNGNDAQDRNSKSHRYTSSQNSSKVNLMASANDINSKQLSQVTANGGDILIQAQALTFGSGTNGLGSKPTLTTSNTRKAPITIEALGQYEIMFGIVLHQPDSNNINKNSGLDVAISQMSYQQLPKDTKFDTHKNIVHFLKRVAHRSDPKSSSPSIISWLKWLDLLSVATSISHHSSNTYCNQDLEKSDHKSPIYSFRLIDNNSTNPSRNWLHEIISSEYFAFNHRKHQLVKLSQNVANFIHNGNPNKLNDPSFDIRPEVAKGKPPWLDYDSLTHQWLSFNNIMPNYLPISQPQLEAQQSISTTIYLDLLVYLEQSPSGSIHDDTIKFIQQESGQCLTDIDESLQRSLQAIDNEHFENKSSNNLFLTHNQLECLRNIIGQWRDLLRKLSFRDLSAISSRLGLNKNPYFAQTISNGSKSHANSITSRNLVKDELEFMNHQQEQRQSSSDSDALNNNSISFPSAAISSSQREAMGTVLAIVLGAGLFIIVLNLIVFGIISLRARSRSNPPSRRGVVDSSTSKPMSDPNEDQNDSQSDEMIHSVQLEPIIRKPTLKQSTLLASNQQNREICMPTSGTLRKQLKFNLNEEFNLEQQQELESILTETALSYGISDEAIVNQKQKQHHQHHQEQNPYEDQNVSTSFRSDVTIIDHQHHQHQQHYGTKPKQILTVSNDQDLQNYQPLSDQWSQTVCSEMSSNQDDNNNQYLSSQLNSSYQINHNDQQDNPNHARRHHHQHHHNCPMNMIYQPYALSPNSSATISVTPPNNYRSIAETGPLKSIIPINYSPSSLILQQTQAPSDFEFLSALELSLRNNSSLE